MNSVGEEETCPDVHVGNVCVCMYVPVTANTRNQFVSQFLSRHAHLLMFYVGITALSCAWVRTRSQPLADAASGHWTGASSGAGADLLADWKKAAPFRNPVNITVGYRPRYRPKNLTSMCPMTSICRLLVLPRNLRDTAFSWYCIVTGGVINDLTMKL